MRVAVCDDENVWVNKIEEYLLRFKESHEDIEWEVFYSGEQLVEHYSRGGVFFDILILDIELKELSGIETALKIREADKKAAIFFMTSHTKYVYDCFKPAPANFWVKPVEYEVLRDDFEEVIRKSCDMKKELVFKCRGEYKKIPRGRVIYIASSAKKVLIGTESGNFEIYGTLKGISDRLGSRGFSSPHKSYVVNLDKVETFNAKEVILSGGEHIPVSKSRRQQFKKDFLEYVSGDNYDIYGD